MYPVLKMILRSVSCFALCAVNIANWPPEPELAPRYSGLLAGYFAAPAVQTRQCELDYNCSPIGHPAEILNIAVSVCWVREIRVSCQLC